MSTCIDEFLKNLKALIIEEGLGVRQSELQRDVMGD
ncbi:hypothetical protein EYZ11_005532 [Aspergillus tanneri]|uniref:Uncharacterized protein n=1 Tax=Aspergillus tanneri TaxID=1220188 RepID=A0A4S3JHQ2_9EURO|nr:hypothetical protein EYZ11_005532 [Aspergillus tanneri]